MSEAAEQHQWQGQKLYDAGKVTEALAERQIASQLDPDNANNHLWIGWCLRVKADETQDKAGWKEAAAAFQRATEIAPANSYAHHSLAGMYWRLKRKREAVSELRTAVNLDPNNLEAWFQLGTGQVRTGDFRGTVQTIRTINNHPNSEEVKEYLADPDRTRKYRQFLMSLGVGLTAILAGVWIWRRRKD